MIKISKGLDLPINGKPEQNLASTSQVISRVGVTGFDYIGCKPTMHVKAGDVVKKGQLLFSDKKTQGVHITAPASGTVVEVNRGERRVLESVVIEVDSATGGNDAISFPSYTSDALANLDKATIIENLSQSGAWTALRTRPFSRVPATNSEAKAIFITAMDTNPLAADPALFINDHAEDFKNGLTILSKLAPKVYLCQADGKSLPTVSAVQVETFAGKHPAGNAGTHIHFLAPVSRNSIVWTIGYQDVVAIGRLFTTGEVFTDRYISIAGPQVTQPQIVKTRAGADLNQLTAGLVKAEAQSNQGSQANRMISGSVWNGRTSTGNLHFLGQYHNQVTVLTEGTERKFMGWLTPGSKKFSVLNLFTSSFNRKKTFDFTTTTNGSERAMVPVGQFEAVMPLDILPTQLLRALVVGDIVTAMNLGCLELDEEDLALCTFACSGKYEYGPILRDNLTRIEKET